MNHRLTILAAVTALALSAGAASAGASTTTPTHHSAGQTMTTLDSEGLQLATTTKSNGIIMRDGGVCDPIRHMGC
jgi:hypothetical protein